MTGSDSVPWPAPALRRPGGAGDDRGLVGLWGEMVTRIDLAAGQRTELTVTAEVDAPSDKDGR